MDLHAAFSDFLGRRGQSELPEASDFSEQLSENLREGEFYLIVVADKISDTARETIEFLNRKLQKLRVEIVEVEVRVRTDEGLCGRPCQSLWTVRDLQARRTTFAEMLEQRSERICADQEFKRSWESDPDWTP
jgi:hypothetical protein